MSFDRIAKYYDRLASIVFGLQWKQVQMAPASCIGDTQEVLIVGGGTGRLLTDITAGTRITYLELSAEMINRAKQRDFAAKVDFVESDFLTWEGAKRFDVVVMSFFLDCFDEEELQKVIERSKNRLVPGGQLIVVDFQRAVWWQHLLVHLMYAFFRLTAGITGHKLLNLRKVLSESGYQEQDRKEYFGGWVFCAQYLSP